MMTYKPDQQSSNEPVDISQVVMKSLTSSDSGFRGKFNTLQRSSGTTNGELEMPEAAPLIFPALDAVSDAQKQNALKKSHDFVMDYFDRRAQATYVRCALP